MNWDEKLMNYDEQLGKCTGIHYEVENWRSGFRSQIFLSALLAVCAYVVFNALQFSDHFLLRAAFIFLPIIVVATIFASLISLLHYFFYRCKQVFAELRLKNMLMN